jgi:hypothetical protein
MDLVPKFEKPKKNFAVVNEFNQLKKAIYENRLYWSPKGHRKLKVDIDKHFNKTGSLRDIITIIDRMKDTDQSPIYWELLPKYFQITSLAQFMKHWSNDNVFCCNKDLDDPKFIDEITPCVKKSTLDKADIQSIQADIDAGRFYWEYIF